MMKPKTIAQRWQDYRTDCVPKGAGPEQVTQTRFAFYAGFDAMLLLTVYIASLTDAQAVQALEEVHGEMREFRASLRQGGDGEASQL